LIPDFFKRMKQLGLNNFVGRPEKLRERRQNRAVKAG